MGRPAIPLGAMIQLQRRSENSVAANYSSQIFEQVRDRIMSGAISEGSELPSARDVAIALGVNRATVQKAFHGLAQAGYLRRGTGTATVVMRPRREPLNGDVDESPSDHAQIVGTDERSLATAFNRLRSCFASLERVGLAKSAAKRLCAGAMNEAYGVPALTSAIVRRSTSSKRRRS